MTRKFSYRYILMCPGCGKTSEAEGSKHNPPIVNCGDCLVDQVEISEMKIVRVDVVQP